MLPAQVPSSTSPAKQEDSAISLCYARASPPSKGLQPTNTNTHTKTQCVSSSRKLTRIFSSRKLAWSLFLNKQKTPHKQTFGIFHQMTASVCKQTVKVTN